MIQPSAVERLIGLTTFYTPQHGVGGILRFNPEDFIVEEIQASFPKDSQGHFLLVWVQSRNWETNDLIRELANKLHISKNRISFAGTKDKRAVTSQVFCFYRITEEKIQSISIPDVTCEILHRTIKRVKIGDLNGNKFTITIRDIDPLVNRDQVEQIIQELQVLKGFPNFFGVQRFGGIRPITHLVGRAMVNADFEQAVMIYLTKTSPFEGEDATFARKKLAKTLDFKQGFHEFPYRLRYEKILMQHLSTNPDDFTGALQKLPGNLLTMFVYAFQSYLFNKMLSQRIIKKLPLNEAIIGDDILPITRSGISKESIRVSNQNMKKVNEQILKGKAVVSSVIPGSETTYSNGPMGEIQEAVINEEHVDIRDFIIPEIPSASSYGTKRAILSPISTISSVLDEDEFNKSHQKLTLSFSLVKGSYATSFLREIMKLEDITKY